MSDIPKCRGITKSGRRCKRGVEEEGFLCWQHEKDSDKKEDNAEKSKKKKTDGKPRKVPKPGEKIKKLKQCLVEGCKCVQFKGNACVYHSCHDPKCNSIVFPESLWCSSHRCQQNGCKSRKRANGTSCVYHKCWMKNCYNLRDERGHYCQSHSCSVKSCKNVYIGEDSGKKYCPEHKKQYSLEKPEECPVCLEEFKIDEEPWPCGHYIHRSCITQSLKAECPLCRARLYLRPEEEREINDRSNQVREERNRQFVDNFQNQQIIDEMMLRFGPSYLQILDIIIGNVRVGNIRSM